MITLYLTAKYLTVADEYSSDFKKSEKNNDFRKIDKNCSGNISNDKLTSYEKVN